MHTCYFCPFYQREWTWETITLLLSVSHAPGDSTVVDNPKMRSQKWGRGSLQIFLLFFVVVVFCFLQASLFKKPRCMFKRWKPLLARSLLHEDQLITTAERELVRKTHLPGDYLKEESSWADALWRKHQLLRRVVGDTPLLSAFLRAPSTVIHSHAFYSCVRWPRNARWVHEYTRVHPPSF